MIKGDEIYEYKLNFDSSFTEKIEIKEKIEKQIKNSACNIIINKENKGVGFLCNIPYESKIIPMLIIFISDIINEWFNKNNNSNKDKNSNQNNDLSIYFFDKVIEIKNIKIRKQFEIEKLKFIEIRPNYDRITTRNILELDDDNKDINNINKYFINTNILIEGEKKLFNFDISNNEFKNEINNANSSSIIFSSDNFKVIGVKNSKIIKFNKEIIDDYISNKINNISIPNYMTLKYIIDKTRKGIRLFGTTFVNKNKNNCKLIINGNEFEFSYYLTDSQIIKLIQIKQEILEIKLEEIKRNAVTDFSCMFYKCQSLKEVDTEWETSHVIDMNHMLYGCESLTYINGISQFNTKNVKYMNEMFCNCKDLKYLPDLSKWDIKNVKNMNRMFYGCKSLKNLPNISNWETKNVMSDKLCGCVKLDIIFITNTNMMFFQCNTLKRLPDISKSNLSKAINDSNIMILTYKIEKNKGVRLFGTNFIKKNKNNCKLFINEEEIEFCNYLTEDQLSVFMPIKNEILEIKLEEKEKNSITDFSYIFCWCLQLYKVDIKWETSHVTNMNHMFCGCESLKSISGISKFNTENAIYMNEMFYNCKNLEYLSDLSKWDIKNVKNMSRMFCGCKSLKELSDISNWKTNNVTDMSSMFCECEKLNYLPDISRWDISNVTNTNMMFFKCKSLKELPDISKWKTSKVTNMSQMFSFCLSLEYLPDISKWNVEKVMFLNDIFHGCENLKCISEEISKWDTSNVIDLSRLFNGCKKLEICLGLPNSYSNTQNVTNMSYMFYQCNSLAILPEILLWNTSKVTNMSYMFCGCSVLKSLPDISLWNTKNVIDMSYLFFECINLEKLSYISKWNLSSQPKANNIFYGVPQLSIASIVQTKFLGINIDNKKKLE